MWSRPRPSKGWFVIGVQPIHLHLAPPRYGLMAVWTPSNFPETCSVRNNSSWAIIYGVVCVILSLAILVQYRLMTDGQTQGGSVTELHLLSTRVSVSTAVSDLGVLVDSQLSMADHVAALSRACLFQLRQLRLVRSSLTTESAKTLVRAFVSSNLDYCNSLLCNVMSCKT